MTHPLSDAPAPVGAIRALGRFHVLAGHQGQQRHRLRRPRAQLLIGQIPQQPVRVADQGIDQPIPGLLYRPRRSPACPDRRSRGRCSARRLPHRTRDLPPHPPDRADQLSHRVLGGHRVIEHRGIQRATGLARQRPGLGHHGFDRLKIRFGRSEAANRRRQYVNVVA